MRLRFLNWWLRIKQIVLRYWRLLLQRQASHQSKERKSAGDDNYFKEAISWADDVYLAAVVARNRYRSALIAAIAVVFVLLFCMVCLIPVQHLQPLLVHHYEDGRVVVEPVAASAIVNNGNQIDNDIVRYVVNRESYDPIAYEEQYRLTGLLSDSAIAEAYIHQQSASNAAALINVLANHQYRTVHIDDVVILDRTELNKKQQQHHRNLAEVHFVVTDHQISNGAVHSYPYTVLLSWEYQKPSLDPEVRWRNWDGFVVTHYQVSQRSLSKGGA
jgi:type IV secretion system protein VirB8